MSDQTSVASGLGPRPPGPDGLPVVGSLFAYERDPYGFITTLAREHGAVARYSILGNELYQLNTPEAIEHVLVTNNGNYVKGELFQRALGPVTGNGVLNSEGAFWRRQRHRIEPAFHPDRIREYAETMVARTRETADRWIDGRSYDVHAEFMSLTLGIVAQALFGADVGRDVDTVGRALETVMTFQEGHTAELLPFELPTPARRRFEAAVDDLDRVVYRIVDGRRRELEAAGALDAEGIGTPLAGASGGDADATAPATHDDVVAWLLTARDDSGARMSRRQVRDEVMTLLLAGHETTALALTFTCWLLAQHSAVEERLVDELDDVLDGRDPTRADLDDLPYLERVVTESLRLYPPVPGIVREAVGDDVVAGYHVPAGVTVSMNQWTVHRDARWYEDPLSFRPERWTDEFRRSLPHLAYFPFSAGPRRCVGDRFALLEATLVLATLLPRYHLELVSPPSLDLLDTVTARPSGPVEMRLHARES